MGELADATPAGLEGSKAVFDRATRLARTLFGKVDAQITLTNPDGVWRSRGGPGFGAKAGLRDIMAGGELLWLEDCAQDPRFCDDPIVVGPPYLRFYAAAPIKLEDGSIAGGIWVAGLEPRAYDRSLAGRLQDLADFVADEWTRLRAEDARRSYERTLNTVINALPVPMVLTDRQMTVLYASPAWIEARGLAGQAVTGRTLFELLPEIFEPWREGLQNCLEMPRFVVERVAIPSPGGSQAWVRVEVTRWHDYDGEVGGLIVTSYDITALVAALENAERSEARLKLAAEIADLHVFELDTVRREVVTVGAATDRFFETPPTFESLTEDVWSTIDPRDRPGVIAAWERHMAEGGPYRPEYRVARSDGREIWVASSALLVADDAGQPLRIVGALHNITGRKEAELALVQAKDDAEAANRAKSAFLATMSHEIRTPLNGVLGMAQAMAKDGLDRVQRERLDVIRQSAESLLAILNDVLDLSKVEAGKLELEHAPFDLDDLARTVHATFGAMADAKGLDFGLVVEKAAKGLYEGDAVRVRQIFWNLIGNALKFTARGSVKVHVARRKGLLRITVADTGIGLSADQAEGIFRKFEQADASTTRRFGGTGLGLAICRELADLMGGSISVESKPGEGATFEVCLPLRRLSGRAATPVGQASAAESAPADVTRPIRVLAAEDNGMNQLVLKTLLGQVGVEPVIVSDGVQAVEAWSQEVWDVILMDVQMPVMDGPTATAIIRGREGAEGRARTPIIALTANAMSHQVAEYLAGGMDAVVPKPIEAMRLYEALQAAIDGTSSRDAAAA